MPHAEDRYYTPTSPTMMQYHSGPSSSSSQVKQASGPQVPLQYQQQLPAQLTFTDPTTLLNFMSTLPSPQALLAITSLTISFQPFMLSRQMVHQVGMGVHLLLRYTHNLTHLTLDWADAPSSVLTGTSFRLRAFASPILVDATVIAFLEAQPLLQTLTLGAWGAHLPPYGVIFPASSGAHTDASNSSFYGSFYPSADFSMLAPTPPILSPTALPHLAEFTGHAEVASQLAAGGRPLQSVHLTSGLPQPSSVIGSAAATTGWREIFGGLGESPAGIRSLEVGPLVGGFGLEMLAEIGRHLHDLDYLYVRVRKGAQPDVFRFEHWKNYVTTLASLEHLDIEIIESSQSSPQPSLLPTQAHIQTWHRTCPLLSSVSVFASQTSSRQEAQSMDLAMWEWKGMQWVDSVRR